MQSYGLQSHIWNNNLKSGLLLAGFPVLLMLLLFSIILLFNASNNDDLGIATLQAGQTFSRIWYFAIFGALAWFGIAWLFHQKMIEATTGSESLSRKEAPKIYNMVENLCISRGMTMPKINIMETEALNAFASGISDETYTVTLTRGLMNKLDDDELEAVIAHELTHIRNRDVRLLIISIIFVGIFSFIAEMAFRGFFRTGTRMSGYSSGRKGDSRGGGGIIIVALVLIGVAYGLAILIRFAISRRREYLADAGAVDLTRNPDAMIRALQKISGRSKMQVSDDVAQMCIDNPKPFAGLFMTHPSIDTRIKALTDYAGGEIQSETTNDTYGPWA